MNSQEVKVEKLLELTKNNNLVWKPVINSEVKDYLSNPQNVIRVFCGKKIDMPNMAIYLITIKYPNYSEFFEERYESENNEIIATSNGAVAMKIEESEIAHKLMLDFINEIHDRVANEFMNSL